MEPDAYPDEHSDLRRRNRATVERYMEAAGPERPHTFRLEDGLITEYWEYMNPCVEMRALGIEVPRVEEPPFG
jgi:Phenazine biosynthesis protein A/B